MQLWAGRKTQVLPNRRGDSPPFVIYKELKGNELKTISMFVDESGDLGLKDKRKSYAK